MEKITTKDIRPYVKPGQSLVWIQRKKGLVWLELTWKEHKSGTFGPGSAAYANRLRSCVDLKSTPLRLEHIYKTQDRGATTGLVLYAKCPTCEQKCRVLYREKGAANFGCIKCSRPVYASKRWPSTGRKLDTRILNSISGQSFMPFPI